MICYVHIQHHADGDTPTLTTLYPHNIICAHTTYADRDTPTPNLIFIYTVNSFQRFRFEFL